MYFTSNAHPRFIKQNQHLGTRNVFYHKNHTEDTILLHAFITVQLHSHAFYPFLLIVHHSACMSCIHHSMVQHNSLVYSPYNAFISTLSSNVAQQPIYTIPHTRWYIHISLHVPRSKSFTFAIITIAHILVLNPLSRTTTTHGGTIIALRLFYHSPQLRVIAPFLSILNASTSGCKYSLHQSTS